MDPVRTYGGYMSAGTTLARYATGNSTADNFRNTPATVDVPTPRGVLNQQKTIMANLIAANYELPAIELWDYVNVQFVNNIGFNDWPTVTTRSSTCHSGCE